MHSSNATTMAAATTSLVRFEDVDVHLFTAANFFPGHDWQL